ncbi:S-ribosylhomocysteine lyase LuxS involved in autoinducer biosynthesis [Hydrogenophaga palleronii]|uniref:S-ribosylhomocysteine lyase LuxS involved in autoinducer biosynthesis n=1 Tax=Hydrogenophaga palleronii TaxID=65655 RepID=A0ABU1WMI0_9BURK|nr:hypothetical protein [Hydrogenophaga palleronii]MDR7150404.1 S-ribosylhomocysteine lyase LuxS involved in autoinducer biosynthesis [Hydrogenophaga palleronii]
MRRLESCHADHGATLAPYIRGISHRETALNTTTAFTIRFSQAVHLPADQDHGRVQRQRPGQRFDVSMTS